MKVVHGIRSEDYRNSSDGLVSTRCDVYKVAKVVHGIQSENYCNFFLAAIALDMFQTFVSSVQ